MQKIIPCLWFDNNGEEAVRFYTAIFKNSKIGTIDYYGDNMPLPKGTVLTVDFTIEGFEICALNGGPVFEKTPALSFMVYCKTADEVDALYEKLAEDGIVRMELGEYPFSKRYAFFTDKYGTSWQIILGESKQKIVPSMLFVGKNYHQAESAVKLYTALIPHSKIAHIEKYPDGAVMFSAFELAGEQFSAMDGAGDHKFTFTEGVSLLVQCKDQAEVDKYWNALTADGGAESQCGWLKDKFGVSWQITPEVMNKMRLDKDKVKAGRAMQAMFGMKKLDIATLEKAFNGK